MDIFRIIIMGDSSRASMKINCDILSSLLNNITELSPEPNLIFFLGDMVDGGASVVNQMDTWKSLVCEYYPITMYYPCLGSHENNEAAFSDAFSYLPNEQLSGYLRTVYYIDYKSARFIILNSNRTDRDGSYVIDSFQRQWLESILSTSDKKYNFVMFHIPAFPTGHHYGECLDRNAYERNSLWEIIDKKNVTAVFVGHEHNYCRRIISKSNSIYHVTTGGAGSSLNAHISDINNVIIGPVAAYHYVVLDIDDQEIYLQAHDIDNNIIDSCYLLSCDNGHTISYVSDNIIPIGSVWKYLDHGSDEGTFWTGLSFNDDSWNLGKAELGYGDGNESTIVNYGPDAHNKYITTYFRKHFNIDNTSIYKSLTCGIQRDDGAVVYINGKEVYRTNMPQGKIYYNTLACKAVNGFEELCYEKFIIDSNVLISGNNIVAVEIHQVKSSSSDISFNFQLLGNKY